MDGLQAIKRLNEIEPLIKELSQKRSDYKTFTLEEMRELDRFLKRFNREKDDILGQLSSIYIKRGDYTI
jgi:hypothetical protein